MDHLIHVSENPRIRVFTPRTYWHIDYSVSGRVVPGREIPEGAELIEVVWAHSEEQIPFYYLPRAVPRVWLTDKITGLNNEFVAQFCDVSSSYRALVVPHVALRSIESFAFYKYLFARRYFDELPNGEWASASAVVPTRMLGPFSPQRALMEDNVTLFYVDDIAAFKARLTEAQVSCHAENL